MVRSDSTYFGVEPQLATAVIRRRTGKVPGSCGVPETPPYQAKSTPFGNLPDTTV